MAKGKYEYWLTEDGLILLEGWAKDGLTYDQIAKEKLGISRSTLTEWRKKYPSISDALKSGREVPDRKVENSLYKSCVGYYYDEYVEEIHVLPDGREEKIKKRHKRYYQPSITAIIFYLKNRCPDKWRDKPKQETNAFAIEWVDAVIGAEDE